MLSLETLIKPCLWGSGERAFFVRDGECGKESRFMSSVVDLPRLPKSILFGCVGWPASLNLELEGMLPSADDCPLSTFVRGEYFQFVSCSVRSFKLLLATTVLKLVCLFAL